MESLLSMETRPDGHEATDKTRYYQLRTFRLVDVYKVVSSLSVAAPLSHRNPSHLGVVYFYLHNDPPVLEFVGSQG
jgi:hypothetical protein